MKLTIIIPVYQVERTLRRCVESVLGQQFRDWQLILVDDASTDGSGKICDELARQNPRIQVIHMKRNTGLSAARNAGLDKAKGEYLTFIDSDDYIADDTLKSLMEEIAIHPDYDILEYPVYRHYGSRRQELLQFRKQEYTDMRRYWLEGRAYDHTYAWNKIYRHDIFRGVRFPEGRCFEDVWTLPELLDRCSIVATTDVGTYYYTANPDGITKNVSLRNWLSLAQAHLTVLKELHPTPSRRNYTKRLDPFFADYYASVLNIMISLYDMSPETALRLVKDKETPFPILPYRHTYKLRLLHILGFRHLCRIHRFLIKTLRR